MWLRVQCIHKVLKMNNKMDLLRVKLVFEYDFEISWSFGPWDNGSLDLGTLGLRTFGPFPFSSHRDLR